MARPPKNKRIRKQYNTLVNAGFLPEEAGTLLSSMRRLPTGKRIRVNPLPLDIPYVKEMIRERARAFRRAKKEGIINTWKEWRETIIDGVYVNFDYLNDEGEVDPWKMLRHWEERYKDKHPEYESPYKEKKRKRKDFDDKWDRGEQKYPKGAAYR